MTTFALFIVTVIMTPVPVFSWLLLLCGAAFMVLTALTTVSILAIIIVMVLCHSCFEVVYKSIFLNIHK